jgi:hypothetical protein
MASGIHNFTSDAEYQYNTTPQSESQMLAIMAKAKVILNPTVKLTIAILIMFCSVIFFKKYIINPMVLF